MGILSRAARRSETGLVGVGRQILMSTPRLSDARMTVQRRLEFVHGQVAWMLAVTVVLVLLDSLSYALFFAGSFVGLLVMIEYTSPVEVTPAWRRRLRWVILLGLLVFGVVILERIVRALPPGVV